MSVLNCKRFKDFFLFIKIFQSGIYSSGHGRELISFSWYSWGLSWNNGLTSEQWIQTKCRESKGETIKLMNSWQT